MDNDIPFITVDLVENRRKISTNINKGIPIYNVKSTIPPYRKPSEVPNTTRISRNTLQSKTQTQTKSGQKMDKQSTNKTECQKPFSCPKKNNNKSTIPPYRKSGPGKNETGRQSTARDNFSAKKTHPKLSGSNIMVKGETVKHYDSVSPLKSSVPFVTLNNMKNCITDSNEPKHYRPPKPNSKFSEWLKNQKKLGLSKTKECEILQVENEETENSMIINNTDKGTVIEKKSVGAITESFNYNRSEPVTCKNKDTTKGNDQFTKKAPSLKKVNNSDIKITEQKKVLSSNTSSKCDLAILKKSEEKFLSSRTKTDHDVGRTRITNKMKSLTVNKSDDADIQIIYITGKKKLSPNVSVDCVSENTLPHYQEKLSSKTTAGISSLDDQKNKSSNKNCDIEITAQSKLSAPKRKTHRCSKKKMSHNEKKRSSLTKPAKVPPLKTPASCNDEMIFQRCHKREPYSRTNCCSLKSCQPELRWPTNEMKDFQMDTPDYEALMEAAVYKVKYEESLRKLQNNYHRSRPASSRSCVSPPDGRISPFYGSNWGYSAVGGGPRRTTYEPRYKTNNCGNRPGSSRSWVSPPDGRISPFYDTKWGFSEVGGDPRRTTYEPRYKNNNCGNYHASSQRCASPPCCRKNHCYGENWRYDGFHQCPRPETFEPKHKEYFCMSHSTSSEDE